jgi:hypothetical protein
MDPDVFKIHVAPVLFGLWPRMSDGGSTPLTVEQKKSWVRVVGNYSAEQACEALRRMFDDGPKYPEPVLLRQKLNSLFGTAQFTESANTNQERERWEKRQHEIAQVIDSMTDDQLAGHALMYAASNQNLLWTLALNPRKDPGLRAAVTIRAEMSLKPDDDAAPDHLGDGKYGIKTIPRQAIDRASRIRAGQEPMPNGGAAFMMALDPSKQPSTTKAPEFGRQLPPTVPRGLTI